jgi:hypothetical protein
VYVLCIKTIYVSPYIQFQLPRVWVKGEATGPSVAILPDFDHLYKLVYDIVDKYVDVVVRVVARNVLDGPPVVLHRLEYSEKVRAGGRLAGVKVLDHELVGLRHQIWDLDFLCLRRVLGLDQHHREVASRGLSHLTSIVVMQIVRAVGDSVQNDVIVAALQLLAVLVRIILRQFILALAPELSLRPL